MNTNTKIAIGGVLLFFAIFFSIKIGLGNMADGVSGFFTEVNAKKLLEEDIVARQLYDKAKMTKERIEQERIKTEEFIAKQKAKKSDTDIIKRMANDIESLEDEIKELQQSLTLKEKEVLAQAKELDKAKRAERKEVVEGEEDEFPWGGFVVFLFVCGGCFLVGRHG